MLKKSQKESEKYTEIPRSVRVEETATEGKSIFAYDAKGKVADAYKRLVLEVKEDGKERI